MRFRTLLVTLLLLSGPGSAAPAAPAGPGSAPAATPADSLRRAPQTLQQVLDWADTLLARRGGMHAEDARIYLTWDAPYGMPRATRTHTPRAHDPRGADTLWLSFLPGRPSDGFMSFSADLYFRAAPGDTLGPWWHMERTAQNRGSMVIQFGPDATFPQRQPWAVGCDGVAELRRTPASAWLHIIAAIPYTEAVGINADSVYTLCRIILRHNRVLPGCSQPVCVEWATAQLGYTLKDEPTVNVGERFVAYATGEGVCESFVPLVREPPPSRPASPKPARPPKGKRPAR